MQARKEGYPISFNNVTHRRKDHLIYSQATDISMLCLVVWTLFTAWMTSRADQDQNISSGSSTGSPASVCTDQAHNAPTPEERVPSGGSPFPRNPLVTLTTCQTTNDICRIHIKTRATIKPPPGLRLFADLHF